MMTEVAGLTFGLVAATLLWRGMRSENLKYYAFGSLLLTIGLAIRTGAVLVLGSAMLWPLIGLGGRWQSRLRWAGVSGIAILAGILLTWIWTALLYNGESAPGENFAFSLYGLAHGGLPWQTFFEDFDTRSLSEANKRLWRIAKPTVRFSATRCSFYKDLQSSWATTAITFFYISQAL